ncbi:hypothetical protein PPL_04533 [Heterostelium album PN500]|uniref:Uncharacterized protein n=1 Tax=Heterostelium pallidum (strain ATCC 26659 / Pp 5 / PN500) TaxID=670386 RepID=D3B7U5_HETP5|nr:hypothetical protein PPL_04533 [Heterostelium album PN500]EFA82838.1 hypothetical protein PPL_04533 [Heterostelium album PN500]|eukprot:XP_020434955.1 hypothetical protein PPL_04533 [Heterostelium album PN500]
MISSIGKLSHVRGIIFDLDGTLTKPIMDFKKLRSDLGITTPGVDILEVIKTWSHEKQVEGHKIIYDFEREASLRLEFQPGASALMDTLERLNIKKAIHSRNSIENIEYFQERFGYTFSPIVGREIEPKPSPAGSHHIAKHWQMQPSEILFVGDSQDDMRCSRAFGSLSILLLNSSNKHYTELSDIAIESLSELSEALEQSFKNKQISNSTSTENSNLSNSNISVN